MAVRWHLSTYLDTRGYSSVVSGQLLNDRDIIGARKSLESDMDAFLLNAIISFSGCLSSIKRNNYSWSFIQSYYALFFAAKSLLANSDIGVYYLGTKPFKIKLSRGETFQQKKGNSHQIVFELFKKQFATDLFLCGEIDGDNVIDWFNKQRENINYKLNPMTDPNPPVHLFKYEQNLREYLALYPNSYDYSLSKEHGYVAFIYNLILRIIDIYASRHRTNGYLTKEFIDYLRINLCDDKGAFSDIIRKIQTMQASI